MQIDNLMLNSGASVYYDPLFRNVLEDHMTYLRGLTSTQQVSIKSREAYKFAGDMFGLLQVNNIKPEYHWIVMRLNKYSSPTQIDDKVQTLLIPDFTVIERLRNVFNTKTSINY